MGDKPQFIKLIGVYGRDNCAVIAVLLHKQHLVLDAGSLLMIVSIGESLWAQRTTG